VALAQEARLRQPDLHIIFVTGDPGAAHDAARLNAALLLKPYAPDDLARLLADLDGPSR
jgi:DNA-binding LytR/AlgR family response regulator